MKIHEEGFRIAMQKEVEMNREQVEEFYDEHRGQSFFDDLINCMTVYELVFAGQYMIYARLISLSGSPTLGTV